MLGQFTGYKEIDVDVSDQFSFKISEIKRKKQKLEMYTTKLLINSIGEK